MSRLTLESEYLIKLIKCAINEEPIEPAPEGIDWSKLFELSRKQQVYSIIAEVLDLNCLPKNFAEEMKIYIQNELLRTLSMKSEFQEIENQLDEKQIKYMLLKGSVLKNYYPKQKMRQMSDMDILFDKKQKNEVASFMKKRGYSLISSSVHSDDYFKKPFYTFEFHKDLFEDECSFDPDFSFVWENAEQDNDRKYKYNMSVSDLYLHTICHMYKHYILGGFGIRFLCDIYLILKKQHNNLDFDYIDSKLNEFSVKKFEETVKTLSIDIFDKLTVNSSEIEFLKNIMKFGIYGNSDQGVKLFFDDFAQKHQGEKHLLFKYYLGKIFPNFDFMKKNYQVLEKIPILLPFFYIVRVFQKLSHKRNYILTSYRVLKEFDKENKDKK